MAGDRLRIFVRTFLFGPEVKPDDAKSRLVKLNPTSLVQSLRSNTDGNPAYLQLLAAQSLHAKSTRSLLAKKPEIDLLLRAAGTTQISRAIREKGAKSGEPFIVVVAGPRRVNAAPGLEEIPEQKLSEGELGKVEKAALLSAFRG
jgi:tRNA threonylcarbamoyladenosine modification (KEOPS) complex Cgi121 subunit